ncbi:hypothetical protein HDU87_005100 [Geranomyces variabilis]|uniref:Uncharacterized protein n=1 Tax=Geranomyces variabilis TaxID=109894 RepID=A0AAD5XVE6_9FUNG|nr:hypothetical protein HDU87_005100 [Geranomyces variabilis]
MTTILSYTDEQAFQPAGHADELDDDFGDDEALLEELDAQQLRQQLKDCMMLLRQRERDLTTAAEVGQHLLQAHAAMKEAYDSFVAQRGSANTLSRSNSVPELLSAVSSLSSLGSNAERDAGAAPSRALRRSTSAKPGTVASASGCAGGSTEDIYASTPAFGMKPAKRRQQDMWKTSLDYLSGPAIVKSVEYLAGLKTHISGKSGSSWAAMHKIQETSSQGSVGPSHSSDYVANLERSNMEQEGRIAELTTELRETAQARAKEAERYARHLEETRGELARVVEQADSLEKERKRRVREARETRREKVSAEQAIDTLALRLRQSQQANEKLAGERAAVEQQLELAATELGRLQDRVDEYERGLADDEGLRSVCEKQEVLIKELQEQLEEARSTYLTDVVSFEAQRKAADAKNEHRESLHELLSENGESASHSTRHSTTSLRISASRHASQRDIPRRRAPFRWQAEEVRYPSTSRGPSADPDQQFPDEVIIESARSSMQSVISPLDDHSDVVRPSSLGPSIIFALIYGLLKGAWRADATYEDQKIWNAAVGDGILGSI